MKLLGPDVPATPVLTPDVVLDTRDLRLEDPQTLADIGFAGTDHRLTEDGLRLEPRTSDPYLLIDPGGKFNVLELEAQVGVAGYLEVFWSTDNQPFAEERKRTVWLSPSPAFELYTVDLWADLDLRAHAYRFRLDPVNQRAPVTIRSLVLRRVIYMPPATPATRPARGQITLDGQTRPAAAFLPAQRLSTALDIHDDDVLTFALAVSRDNDMPVVFQVLVGAPNRTEVAWEERLPVDGPQSWREHRVPLGRFAGPDRRLVLATREPEDARGPLGVAMVLCAEPTVSAAEAPSDHESAIRPTGSARGTPRL